MFMESQMEIKECRGEKKLEERIAKSLSNLLKATNPEIQ